MAGRSPHIKIIRAAARQMLLPLGLIEAQSRLWVDDHVWWLIVVEFQPSGWSKGSYLNVGAMWLTLDPGHFSFSEGYRVSKAGFVDYTNDEQFQEGITKMSGIAAERVSYLRKRFSSMAHVAYYLHRRIKDTPSWAKERTKSAWELYEAAIFHGYVGKTRPAIKLFKRFEDLPASNEVVIATKERARLLREMLSDGDIAGYKSDIEGYIAQTRSSLKPKEIENIGESIDNELRKPVSFLDRVFWRLPE